MVWSNKKTGLFVLRKKSISKDISRPTPYVNKADDCSKNISDITYPPSLFLPSLIFLYSVLYGKSKSIMLQFSVTDSLVEFLEIDDCQ